VFSEPPAPSEPKVVFVTGGSGPFWQITINGAKAAAQDLNVDLRVEMPTEDESLEQQMAILSELDPAEQSGIAISPLDAAGQTDLINRFADQTNVVTFDADAPQSERQCYVGTSNYDAGRLCATLVKEAIPAGGKVAVLLANLTKSNLIDRKQGFQESMDQVLDEVAGTSDQEELQEPAAEYEVVGYFVDGGDSAKSAQIIRDTLAQHPDLACFVGMNAQHGPILLRVLKEEGQLGAIKLVTFDEEAETLDGVEAGDVFATIAQDPYQCGYEAVSMLAKLHRGTGTAIPIVGRGAILVYAEAIRQDNLDDFRARLESRLKAPPADQASKKSA
jgi:ribose transport system substrate-binding protein